MLAAILAATLTMPYLAYPVDDALPRDPAVARCFSALLDAAGNGRRNDERGAFLVREGGTFRCALWPSRFGYQRADWSGPVPDGAIAIVHTHPMSMPLPSAQDRREAERIGAPILVLTPGRVWAAMPDGSAVELAKNSLAPGVVDNLRRDETRTDRPPHSRQARALPDEGS